jgi:hypothetical protein
MREFMDIVIFDEDNWIEVPSEIIVESLSISCSECPFYMECSRAEESIVD